MRSRSAVTAATCAGSVASLAAGSRPASTSGVEGRGRDRVAPGAVAAQVEDDRRQPRRGAAARGSVRLVAAERAVGPDERVLGDLLGVVRVAQQRRAIA